MVTTHREEVAATSKITGKVLGRRFFEPGTPTIELILYESRLYQRYALGSITVTRVELREDDE